MLTIDEPLQYDAEQALAQAIVAANAKDGIALLMDSKTGEILADAQLAMPTAGNTSRRRCRSTSRRRGATRPPSRTGPGLVGHRRSPTCTSPARSTS